MKQIPSTWNINNTALQRKLHIKCDKNQLTKQNMLILTMYQFAKIQNPTTHRNSVTQTSLNLKASTTSLKVPHYIVFMFEIFATQTTTKLFYIRVNQQMRFQFT